MDNRPVGVFDSGLGGLTAVRVLRRLLPQENIIYFADTGRMPYGGRPLGEIRLIARQNADFLLGFGVKAVLAACGTVSGCAPDVLDGCPVPAVGVIAPGARALAAKSTPRLGVIATEASIASGAYQRELKRLRPDAEITAIACPEFVPAIESGHYDRRDPQVIDVVRRSLEKIKAADVGALLLGCTHYGLIAEAIGDCLGEGVELVGASDEAARSLAALLKARDILGRGGAESYYTSGNVEDFKALAPVMLGYELAGGVHYTEPEETAYGRDY